MTALLGSVTRPRMVPRSCPQHIKVAVAIQRIGNLVAGNRRIRGSFVMLNGSFDDNAPRAPPLQTQCGCYRPTFFIAWWIASNTRASTPGDEEGRAIAATLRLKW